MIVTTPFLFVLFPFVNNSFSGDYSEQEVTKVVTLRRNGK